MRSLRLLGTVVLTACALLGVCGGAVWVATTVGWIKPLIVVSGSMEPEIMVGDLLVARPFPVDAVAVGDVLSLTSDITGDIVTHRVIEVSPGADGIEVRMRGDANESPDGETYLLSDTVWTPRWQWSGGGFVLRSFTRPQVAMPALVGIIALTTLLALPPAGRRGTGPARSRTHHPT